MRSLANAWARFDAWFEAPGEVRALAVLRLLVGPIVLVHLWPFLEEMVAGRYFADYFYSPWVSWMPVPPRGVYFAMLSACAVSAALMSVGLWTRWATAYAAFFVTMNFFQSETFFRHNRNFLVMVLWMLALVPCGRVLSLDAWLGRRSHEVSDTRGSLWPMMLMRFEVVCVYAASSISKLLNPDWRSGRVLLERSEWHEPLLRASVLPSFVVDLVTDPTFHSAFAKFAIVNELTIATLLLTRRFRYVGIYVALTFHALIEISLNVQIFSYLAAGGLLIWVTPRVRDRVLVVELSSPRASRFLGWVRRLDWLARFRLEPVQKAGEPSQGGVRLLDRDGRVYEGRRAKLRALLLCPLTFWFVAPLVLWDRLRSNPPEGASGPRSVPPPLAPPREPQPV